MFFSLFLCAFLLLFLSGKLLHHPTGHVVSEKEKSKPAPSTIIRAKFNHPVKLGTGEFTSWTTERPAGFTCHSTANGLVFKNSTGPGLDIVVPYTNVINYEMIL